MPLNLFLQVEAEPCPWVLHQDTELGWLVTMMKHHYFVFTVGASSPVYPCVYTHHCTYFIASWLSVYALYWLLDCHNRIPETRWLTQNKMNFLTVLEAGHPRPRFQVQFLVRRLPLVCSWWHLAVSSCLFLCVHALTARKFQYLFFFLVKSESESRSVVSDSLWPHRL